MTALDWFLFGLLAFCFLCAVCALALNWAGRDDDKMANDWWKDV